MQYLFVNKEEFVAQHSLWGCKGSLLPLRKGFRSTLCISVAALFIHAASATTVFSQIAPPTSTITIKKVVNISESQSNTDDITDSTPTEATIDSSADENIGMVIHGIADVDTTFSNTGNISLNNPSFGTAGSTSTPFQMGIGTRVEDIVINNDGAITLETSGRNNTVDPGSIFVQGIKIHTGSILNNTGDITVTASGGDDAGDVGIKSMGFAHGIETAGNVDNSGNITATAKGGNNAADDAHAFARAIKSSAIGSADGSLLNNGNITATAIGGDNAGDDADAFAFGLWTSARVTNNGNIIATANGGDKAYDRALGEAFGIFTEDNNVENHGALTVTANNTDYSSGQYASGYAYGILAGYTLPEDELLSHGGLTPTSGLNPINEIVTNDGDAPVTESKFTVTNDGDILVTASGGTSTGADKSSNTYATAQATGVKANAHMANSGNVTVSATAGTTELGNPEQGVLNSNAYAQGQGLNAEGKITNSGSINVSTQGGTASLGQIADVSAFAIAIEAGDSVQNDGNIIVSAQGGTVLTTNTATADAEAYAFVDSGAYANGAMLFATSPFKEVPHLENNADITITALSDTVSITNTITTANVGVGVGVDTDADTEVYAQAYANNNANTTGIYSSGSITNNGSINITTHAGTVSITNTVIANNLTNKIEVSADADTEVKAYISANADTVAMANGIRAEGNVQNNTSVNATALGGTVSITNTGTSNRATAYANARARTTGISTYSGDIENNGNVSVNARAGTVSLTNTYNTESYANARNAALAYGISTNIHDENFGNVKNLGNINTTAQGGTISVTNTDTTFDAEAYAKAYAIHAKGYTENHGKIYVIAEGGTASITETGTETYVEVYAEAYGIEATGHIGNFGNISTIAQGGTVSVSNTDTSDNFEAYADATGISSAGDVTNSGKIYVRSHAGILTDGEGIQSSADAQAIGIATTGEASTVHSSGLIEVIATPAFDDLNDAIAGGTQKSYQIYSELGNTTITGFAMEFGGSQDEIDERYEGSIGANSESEGTITFSDDAELYVYASRNLKSGENEYTIPALIEGDSDQGYFAEYTLKAASPDYSILSLSPKSDSELQTLSIKYDPQVSTPQFATSVKNVLASRSIGIVKTTLTNSIMTNMLTGDPKQIGYEGVLLASTKPIADTSSVILGGPRKKNSVFIQPYYTSTNNDSSPMGYDADIYGLSGGYNYHSSGNLIIGYHAGFGKADIDYSGIGYDQRTEEIDAGSFGFHGISRFNDNWLLTASSSFFTTANDYADSLSTNRETADYTTYGTETKVDLGYILNYGQNTIIPEISLTHLWQHNEEYTTANLDNASTTYGSMNENELYAQAGVSWYGNYKSDNWQIVPNLHAGIEQTLTDGKFSNTMTAGTAVQTVTYDEDRTSLNMNAGINFSNDVYSFAAGYNGSYSSHISDNSLFVQAMIRF